MIGVVVLRFTFDGVLVDLVIWFAFWFVGLGLSFVLELICWLVR